MTRDEAIAILSRQPAEVREAAAVFVEATELGGWVESMGNQAYDDGCGETITDIAERFRKIEPS